MPFPSDTSHGNNGAFTGSGRSTSSSSSSSNTGFARRGFVDLSDSVAAGYAAAGGVGGANSGGASGFPGGFGAGSGIGGGVGGARAPPPAYGTPIDPAFLDRSGSAAVSAGVGGLAGGAGGSGRLDSQASGGPYQSYPMSPAAHQTSSYVYGSKRDLWESSLIGSKTESLFNAAPPPPQHPTPTRMAPSTLFHQATQHEPSKSGTSTTPDVPAPRRSRNAIFDTQQTILKPALKMTPEEINQLKSGPTMPERGTASSLAASAVEALSENTATAIPPQAAPPPSEGTRESAWRPPAYPTAPPPAVTGMMFGVPPPSSRRGFVDLGSEGIPRRPSPSATIDAGRNVAELTAGERRGLVVPTTSTSARAAKRASAPMTLRSLDYSDTVRPSDDGVDGGERPRLRPGRRRPEGLSVITNPASEFDNIHLSFLPLRKNYLGEGRYAQVYLGQYTTTAQPRRARLGAVGAAGTAEAGDNINNGGGEDAVSGEFLPCAVKRMHATAECQAIGLAEAFVLRRIGRHPHIVQLVGVKDENDVEAVGARERFRASVAAAAAGAAAAAAAAAAEATMNAAPRMLILLEYAAGGTMWDYIDAMRESGGIGQELWLRWSRQLASAVDFIHSLGIVHHDIKPHNCL
ncbi:hypothetical protein HK405_011856, partial [Cladochytrium tenue]